MFDVADTPPQLFNLLFDDEALAKARGEKPQTQIYELSGRAPSRYYEVALERECDRVRNALKGTRNDTLNRAAFSLGQLICDGGLDRPTVERELMRAALACGLGEAEAAKTIKSGLDDGMMHPRQIKPMTQHTPASYAEEQAANVVAAHEQKDESYLIRLPLTDLGNAECLAERHGENVRYDNINKKWLMWDGQRWAMDSRRAVERMMNETMRARRDAYNKDKNEIGWKFAIRSENAAKIEAGMKRAQALEGIVTVVQEYDTNTMLACAGDTTIDLETVTMRPSNRNDLITMRTGADYYEGATCPTWLQFMEELFPAQPAMQAYVQRAWGYSLTGDIREQCFFMCHGLGANGKSTFLNVLHALLGDYAQTADFTLFEADTSESRSDLANFRAARVLTVAENDQDKRLAEGRIKRITGGEKITARELYAMPFTYKPKFKLWMAMNHKPVIRGADDGIWRRIQFITFSQSFKGREDKTLEQRLRGELSGILNWALHGLRDWHAQGLNPPAEVRQATEEYRRESDLIGQWIEACCLLDNKMMMNAADGYESYTKWCEEVGLRAVAKVTWGRQLREKNVQPYLSSGQAKYRGIGLRDNRELNIQV
jgi:putative DNA primase/helicase